MLFERARSVQNGLKRVPPVFIAELEIVLPPRKVIIEVSQIHFKHFGIAVLVPPVLPEPTEVLARCSILKAGDRIGIVETFPIGATAEVLTVADVQDRILAQCRRPLEEIVILVAGVEDIGARVLGDLRIRVGRNPVVVAPLNGSDEGVVRVNLPGNLAQVFIDVERRIDDSNQRWSPLRSVRPGIVGVEPHLVLRDRPAYLAAPVVLADNGRALREPLGLELVRNVIPVQGFVVQVISNASAKVVPARLGDEVEDSPTRLAELGRNPAGRDLNFLQRIVRDIPNKVSHGRIDHLEAVHAVVVGPHMTAVYRVYRRKGIGTLHDARLKTQNVLEFASGGNVLEQVRIHRDADTGAPDLDQRRFPGDGDGLLDSADRHLEIHSECFGRLEDDPLTVDGREAGQLCQHGVRAGRQVPHSVGAIIAGGRRLTAGDQVRRRDGDDNAGHHQPLLVRDLSHDRSHHLLGEGGGCC